MNAITVEPHKPGSARLDDIPEPDECDGFVLVEAIAVGVCGTDVEIVGGQYGWGPAGQYASGARPRIARPCRRPGPNGGLKRGDLVVGIVRRPDRERRRITASSAA